VLPASLMPSAARTPENPDPRSWFGSVTTEPGHPLQPVINRGADRWQPDGTELAQPVTEEVFASDDTLWLGLATTVLVEALLQRGDDADFKAAHFTIERLAAVATDSASVLHELPQLRMRALLAHARAARPRACRRGRINDDGRVAAGSFRVQ